MRQQGCFNHGLSHTREWTTWRGMRKRCQCPTDQAYVRYGGRGILICERWQKFENFLADMGLRPIGKTIDRINNDGPYSPGKLPMGHMERTKL